MNPAELPLRDIHLPEPVAWWPPAPGWWILAAGVLLAAIALGVRAWRRHTRVRRAISSELTGLRRAYRRNGDAQALLSGLSALMRRGAMTASGRRRIAAVSGFDWLAYLDAGTEERPFTNGVGALLGSAPYRGPGREYSANDMQQLIALCERRLREMQL